MYSLGDCRDSFTTSELTIGPSTISTPTEAKTVRQRCQPNGNTNTVSSHNFLFFCLLVLYACRNNESLQNKFSIR